MSDARLLGGFLECDTKGMSQCSDYMVWIAVDSIVMLLPQHGGVEVRVKGYSAGSFYVQGESQISLVEKIRKHKLH